MKTTVFLWGDLELPVAPWADIKADKFPLEQWIWGVVVERLCRTSFLQESAHGIHKV